MRWSKTVTLVEAHAEGEVGRIVTGGVIDVPGATIADKIRHINEVDDSLRRFLVFEPRASAQMSTCLVFPPTRPDADIGFIILQGDKAHAMSGSNSICLVTTVLETGMLPMTEPETIVRIDTASGLVTARAACKNGKVERVTLTMNPSYAHELDAVVDVEGFGKIKVDISYGGIFYALIDPAQFGLEIAPHLAKKLVEAGSAVHRAVNKQLDIAHPELPGMKGISYTMFVSQNAAGELKGATIMPPGRIDRSPCGTGNSARLAVAAARGLAKPGDRFTARSIIDSTFDVHYASDTTVAGRPAVQPIISGRGWIHGIHQLGVDPTDPYPHGFSVSDTWGDAFDLMN
ncbi:MAG: proline racemase family protein [Candidatus Devosia phytovorans]|uniref:Proline racemase family protein n=1 Tax=Candidatus Devosia phytovorans TaxID=3121372 RepID=A0AAJ5VSC9_9HYPH|nr:proline racemase family protein [Devosia sp.]WEK03387.1 MAG: proline racemase family protein [Devosia sp.]